MTSPGQNRTGRFSPYCWRTRYALAHKQLPVETIPWRFTEKDVIAPSGQTLVPVLVDGDRWIADSWTIANYLEDRFPDRPSLFGGAQGRSLNRFYSSFADSLVAAIFPLSRSISFTTSPTRIATIFARAAQQRVKTTLETFVADRDARLPAFRASLAPMRATLKEQPFFGGAQPLYADYAVFGPLQWARCISPYALLAEDDPIRLWRDRLLDCFDGLGRTAPAYDS